MSSSGNLRVVAIVQARMGSTRLPGKVLMPLAGRAVLDRLLDRLAEAKRLDAVVVATTRRPRDSPIVELARRRGLMTFAGPEDDVLARYVRAARRFAADVIVRVTADSPLTDPQGIDAMVAHHLTFGADYTHNAHARGLPSGMTAEVFSHSALERAFRLAHRPEQREHVVLVFFHCPWLFRVETVDPSTALQRRGDIDLTLDVPTDLEKLDRIYRVLGDGPFRAEDVIALIDRDPVLKRLTATTARTVVWTHPGQEAPLEIRFVIRADPATGMGHLNRCLNLLRALATQSRVRPTILLQGSSDTARWAKSAGCPVVRLPAEAARAVPALRRFNQADILIFDLPHVGQALLQAARDTSRFLVRIIDGGDPDDRHSDLLVNPNLALGRLHRLRRLANGLRYALLDETYARVHEQRRIISGTAKQVIVCLGGGSHPGPLRRVLTALAQIPDPILVTVILGPLAPSAPSVPRALHGRATILQAVPNLAAQLSEADLAVVGGGTLLYEAACAGTPAAVLAQTADQAVEARAFAWRGAALCLASRPLQPTNRYVRPLMALIRDQHRRRKLSQAGKRLVDGKGTARLAYLILLRFCRLYPTVSGR